MSDASARTLSEVPAAIKQQIEWDEKKVDRMLQNQRPMTLLAVAALTAIVFGTPPIAGHGPAVQGQDLAILLLACSTLLGMLCGFTGEQFYSFVARGLYGHAGERRLRLRIETAGSQILLITGCAQFVTSSWPWLGAAIGLYSVASAIFWKQRDKRLSEP